jgi:hypothetical protein
MTFISVIDGRDEKIIGRMTSRTAKPTQTATVLNVEACVILRALHQAAGPEDQHQHQNEEGQHRRDLRQRDAAEIGPVRHHDAEAREEVGQRGVDRHGECLDEADHASRRRRRRRSEPMPPNDDDHEDDGAEQSAPWRICVTSRRARQPRRQARRCAQPTAEYAA